MEQKEFMKQVAESEMPDINEVRKSCTDQLKEEKRRPPKWQRAAAYGGAAIVVAVLVCVCIAPVNSFAGNAIRQIKVLLNLNDSEVQIGETQESMITIPDDCEEAEASGITYRTKSYNSLSALSEDIGADIYTWQGTDQFQKDGILLNIVENDYGRIALLYDVAQGVGFDETDEPGLRSVDLFVYIPLSQNTTLGDLMLKNEQLKYSTVDDEGNIEAYRQNREYDLVEQYHSKKLDTEIIVITSKVTTETDGDLGDSVDTDFLYYVYFTLDGMCYQVDCDGTLEAVHQVVEEIDKDAAVTAMEKENFSETEEQSVNDLLYREADGGSISLEKGERITFSPGNGISYKEIAVFLLGKGTVKETGELTADEPCRFTADVSGEYAIYSGDKNITNELVIEISVNEEEDRVLFVD